MPQATSQRDIGAREARRVGGQGSPEALLAPKVPKVASVALP